MLCFISTPNAFLMAQFLIFLRKMIYESEPSFYVFTDKNKLPVDYLFLEKDIKAAVLIKGGSYGSGSLLQYEIDSAYRTGG
ncbi:hypothetical protein BH11BAC4_BH11BAC4_10250 [soil metagenome]